MCEPRKSRVGPVGVVVAAVVGGGTAVAALRRVQTHTATPTKPISAPSVAHSGLPLVWVVLAAAVFVVVAVLVGRWLYVRRRYDVAPAVVDRAPIRAEVIQPRQRELTAVRPVPGATTQGQPVRVRVNARHER